ncbi:hypothetical protein V8G54_013862 [Vigna mungo]|uniref:Thioredoxin domain-containing protein n=1 Tax=Vigna mungo TaxID=3915 RepID=A0AAQ3RWX9_VIGMU
MVWLTAQTFTLVWSTKSLKKMKEEIEQIVQRDCTLYHNFIRDHLALRSSSQTVDDSYETFVPWMARLISPNPIALHRFRPCFPITRLAANPRHCRINTRKFQTLACQTNPNLDQKDVSPTEQEKLVVESATVNTQTTKTTTSSLPQLPNKDVNKNIALVSTLAALGLFLFARLDLGVSLKDLSTTAVPYEEALSNGKPTVVEFYADWCEWEQELDEFGVEGIPHFAFLDKEGNEEGNVVGRLPRQYLLENVDALARGQASVPHARVVGQYSSAETRRVHQVVDPRSHG